MIVSAYRSGSRRRQPEPDGTTLAAQSRRPGSRAMSLVELLLALVFVALVGAALAYFYLGSGKSNHTSVAAMRGAVTRAQDTVCLSNLHTVRQAIAVARASDPSGAYPPSLADLHLGPGFIACPVGHEPYQYDPSTGEVHCTHPGHESY